MKILTVIGARPQFIKAAPAARAFADVGIEEILLHTGQHYDDEMSKIFFDELNIPTPRYNLSISGGSHGAMTGKMLAEIENVIEVENPDYLLVYGDTNSTLAGALAAAKVHVSVIHIEAGLRSWNRIMPEEVNRVMTDHLSSLLFCSSAQGVANLKAEGIIKNVFNTGDIMADAFRLATEVVAEKQSHYFPSDIGDLNDFVLLTVHRAENTDDRQRLRHLVEFINKSQKRPILFALHPRTKIALEREGLRLGPHVRVVAPLGYLALNAVLARASLVITDSGGLQKEAYWSRTPCLTLRTETEWVETIEDGWNRLWDDKIEISDIHDIDSSQLPAPERYGDGRAAERIAQAILNS